MGVYLNPDKTAFEEAVRSKIYVDKTGLIQYTNGVIETTQKYICVSRPRRFGKSIAANMLIAYYSKGCDSSALFKNYQISKGDEKDTAYHRYLNKYDVIFLNMQDFLSDNGNIKDMPGLIEKRVIRELLKQYTDVDYADKENLSEILKSINSESGYKFVFVIDEWDCIFREKKNDLEAQKKYLDFLRNLLKDKAYVALVYMTGILPVKKYGTQSALNMFDEYSMTDPAGLTEYVGFTRQEVIKLCDEFHKDFEKLQEWYDGYQFDDDMHIYNPKSVVDAIIRGRYRSYWTRTETYEALKIYLDMNFDGLRETILLMLGGSRCRINPEKFQNDMTTFQSKDDVLTLLVHLGYLAYDIDRQEVFIPNKEVEQEFKNAVEGNGWDNVIKAIDTSEDLLHATWIGDSDAVAKGIEEIHMDTTSILSYNNENSLSCVISIAYYSAKAYYTVIREFPSGKGFADMVFLPRKQSADKPAIIVELKWDRSAEGAIAQIKEKRYGKALEDYHGNLLLVGINYDAESKKHTCVIEQTIK